MKFHWFLGVTLLWLAGCKPIEPAPSPVVLEPTGFIQRIHDPVMAKEGNTYYVFSTGSRVIVICSPDRVDWRWCGRVFERPPAWIGQAVPGAVDLWAPDISFFNGEWYLYYAASTFGSPRSVIGLATNRTLDPTHPEYRWVDQGLVLESTGAENWNAIDPNRVVDEQGQPWLVFGSYWSGIQLRKLDSVTGKPDPDDPTVYPLAQRPAAGPGVLRSKPPSSCGVTDFIISSPRSTPAVVGSKARTTCVSGGLPQSQGPTWTEREPRCSKGAVRCVCRPTIAGGGLGTTAFIEKERRTGLSIMPTTPARQGSPNCGSSRWAGTLLAGHTCPASSRKVPAAAHQTPIQ